MIRFLISIVMQLLASAIGLMVAMLLLDDFSISPSGFVVAAIVFTVVNVIFEPLIYKMSQKYIPAFRGGVAIIGIFVSLVLTSLLVDGISIASLSTWLLAPFIIWISVVLAGIFLPMVLFKKALSRRGNKDAS